MQLNIFNEFSEFWMATSPSFSSREFSKNIKKSEEGKSNIGVYIAADCII